MDAIPFRESATDIADMDSIAFLDMILDSLSDLDNLSKTSLDGEEQDVISLNEQGELKDTTFDLLDMIMDEHHQENAMQDNTVQDNTMQESAMTSNTDDDDADKPIENLTLPPPPTTTPTTTTTDILPVQSESTASPLHLESTGGDSTAKMTTEALHPALPVPIISLQELTALRRGKRQLLSNFLCHLTDSGR